jgi:hypothetical protein
MADYPDLYADGFSLTVGPFGLVLTLRRVNPPETTGAGRRQGPLPQETVGRIRMSGPLAQDLANKILNAIKAQATGPGGDTTVTH